MDIKRTLITASALTLATAGSSGRAGTLDAVGAVDADALERYSATFSPVAPGPRNRIVVLP